MSVWSELRYWKKRQKALRQRLTGKLKRVDRLSRNLDPAGESMMLAKNLLRECHRIMDYLQECDYYVDTLSQKADIIDRHNAEVQAQ